MDFTEMKGYKGIRSAIDFEKAYDFLSFDFLLTPLDLFGFGVSIISWTMTSFYSIFNVKRGVCQGDPLSPSLFIIVLELLAIFIRNNRQIN